MTHTPTVPVAVSAARGEEVRRRLLRPSPRGDADAEDELYGPALRYYLLFAHCSSLPSGAVAPAPAGVFHDTHDWFPLFVRRRGRARGLDSGSGRQAFPPPEHADRDVDREAVQEIDLRVTEVVTGPES